MNINIPTKTLKELAGYGLLFGAIGIVGHILKAARNMNRVADKLGKSVEELANTAHVDISEAIVDDAVRKVAEREAGRIIERASKNAINAIRDDIRKEVKSAVDKAYTDVKETVQHELKRQIGKLGIDELKAEVVEEMKKEASEKLDRAMDDILEGFNDNLKSVSKIYKSISKAMTGDD